LAAPTHTHTKTLSSHVLALLADTVFARISLLADTVFARISLLADTVFARINLLAALATTRTGRSRLERRHGWQGAVMARRDPWRRRPVECYAIHGAFDTRHVLCRRLSCTYTPDEDTVFARITLLAVCNEVILSV